MTKDKTTAATLTDDQVTTGRMTRRGLFTALGVVGGAAAFTALGARRAVAVTDGDTGGCADPNNGGRGTPTSGNSDSDSGVSCDPAGRAPTGLTDSDVGAPNYDVNGNGRSGN